MAKWTIKPEVTKVIDDRILWSDMNYEQKSYLKYCKEGGQVIEWSSKLSNGKWDQWETCPPKYLWITAPVSGLAYRVKPTEVVEPSPNVEKDQCEDNTMTEHYCLGCGNLVDANGKCIRRDCSDVGGERREYEEDKGVPFNPVDRPIHYGQGKIECIDYLEDFLTKEEYIGYLRGNIAKYLHRWRYKNGLEDLKKAEWYTSRLIKLQEKM